MKRLKRDPQAPHDVMIQQELHEIAWRRSPHENEHVRLVGSDPLIGFSNQIAFPENARVPINALRHRTLQLRADAEQSAPAHAIGR